MMVLKTYRTKAKWILHTDKDSLPIVGYYADGKPYRDYRHRDEIMNALNPGENLVTQGTLFLTGSSRGMSAANLDFVSDTGYVGIASVVGAVRLFAAVAAGTITSFMGDVAVNDYTQIPKIRNLPAFYGNWTYIKQGTLVSIVPYNT